MRHCTRPAPFRGGAGDPHSPSPTGYLHLGVFFTALVNRLTADASKGVFYSAWKTRTRNGKWKAARRISCAASMNTAWPLTRALAPGKSGATTVPIQQSLRGERFTAPMSSDWWRRAKPTPTSVVRSSVRQTRKNRRSASSVPAYGGIRPLPPVAGGGGTEPGEGQGGLCGAAAFPSEARDGASNSDDLIKGTIEMPENDEDIVLLKSDGIPTYHLPTRWTTI